MLCRAAWERLCVTSPARGTGATWPQPSVPSARASPSSTSFSRSATHACPPPRRSSLSAAAGLWSQTDAGSSFLTRRTWQTRPRPRLLVLVQEWVAYIKKQTSCPCIAVNSHSRESIKEVLNAVQTRIREIKNGENNCTGTALLVGIPNVGKSSIVNAMHQIGRVAAAEKGKLKHAIVSSHPGETRDISGYKVASHPNIYVLDSPGVLSPRFANDGSGPRLALTGAIKDSLLEEYDIAQFLLAIVNSGKEYRKWEKLNKAADNVSCGNTIMPRGHNNKSPYASDHTQDFMVKAVRQVLFETISSFNGDLGEVDEFRRLIGYQLGNLQEVFEVSTESSEDMCKLTATKLLNLYRTGRLGHYTLEHVPDVRQEVVA